MVLWSNFFNGNLTSDQSEGACATFPSPLPCVSGKTGKNSQETKGTVPSFFVNCSMEFLFGQKMELIFWKVYQRRAFMTSCFFWEIVSNFKIHATDFVLQCSYCCVKKKSVKNMVNSLALCWKIKTTRFLKTSLKIFLNSEKSRGAISKALKKME